MDEKGRITREPVIARMHAEIVAYSIPDDLTVNTIKALYKEYGVMTEPHGAAGWAGLKQYLKDFPEDARPDQLAVSLETAHPAKFPEEIRKVLNIDPPLPASIKGLDSLEESFDRLRNSYVQFKEYLLDHYNR